MLSILLIIGCLVVLISVGIFIVAIAMLMRESRRDAVSGARQGWIFRRSDKDEEGW